MSDTIPQPLKPWRSAVVASDIEILGAEDLLVALVPQWAIKNSNPKLIESAPLLRNVIDKLIRTVEATGGVEKNEDGTYSPLADPDWLDLGDTYIEACEAIGREPKVAKDEEPTEDPNAEPERPSGDVCTQCGEPIDHSEPHYVCEECRRKGL